MTKEQFKQIIDALNGIKNTLEDLKTDSGTLITNARPKVSTGKTGEYNGYIEYPEVRLSRKGTNFFTGTLVANKEAFSCNCFENELFELLASGKYLRVSGEHRSNGNFNNFTIKTAEVISDEVALPQPVKSTSTAEDDEIPF